MRVQVFRITRKRSLDSALVAHYRGGTRPAEARERPALGSAVSVLVDRVGQGRAALAAAKAIRRGRGAPGKVEVVDVLFAGPPPYEAADAWSDEKIDAWAQASLEWLRARASTAYIFGAYLHRDERSPHLHVLFVPIADDGRLSWNRVEKSFAEDADAGLKGGPIFRSAQSRYHREVASGFGLGRGEIGSSRKHEPINRSVGLVERIMDAPALWSRKQVDEAAQMSVVTAARDRDSARERAGQVEGERDRALEMLDAATAERDQAAAELESATAALTEERERLEVAEAERDRRHGELERNATAMRELQRDRDDAQRAKSAALSALEADRAAHAKVKASWREQLSWANRELLQVRLGRDPVPPSVTELNAAREMVEQLRQARDLAVVERDEATANHDRYLRGELARIHSGSAALAAAVAGRNSDIAEAHAAGVAQLQPDLDAAVQMAETAERGAADAVEHAAQAGLERGRSEGTVELAAVRAEVARLNGEIETVRGASAGYRRGAVARYL